MKKTLTLLITIATSIGIFAQGSIEGTLKKTNGEALENANITIKKDGKFVTGTAADFDGYYVVESLDEGTYELVISYLGTISTPQTIVVVDRETTTYSSSINVGKEIGTVYVPIPDRTIFNRNDITDIEHISKTDLEERRPTTLAEVTAITPKSTKNAEGEVSYGGGRPGTAVYYIDGVSYDNNYIPIAAIKNVKVYNGGIPAKFGNTTSAVIEITTNSTF